MLKRKNKKDRKIRLLVSVGFFLILLSIALVSFKLYQNKSNKLQEDNLKEEFYKEYEEIRNTPKIEFQDEEEIVIEQPKVEESKPINKVSYVGVLKIDKINLERGFVDKNSPYNNVDINIQTLKESDMPDVENGNVILAGHSGSGKTAYFRNLYKLEEEDNISVFYNGYEYKYKVVNIYDIDKTGNAHIVRNSNKNTLTQITSTDPIIAISLNKDNYTNTAIKENKIFSVSILSVDTPKELIGTFGYYSSKDINKFEQINYEIKNNIPIIKENTCGYIIVETINIIECNTHDIFIAKVLDTSKISNLEPMTYKYYHEKLKGTSPKNAPTYNEEVTNNESTSHKYKCNLCGYIYDDAKEQVKFEDLPEDWKCPLCGAPKSQFTKIN